MFNARNGKSDCSRVSSGVKRLPAAEGAVCAEYRRPDLAGRMLPACKERRHGGGPMLVLVWPLPSAWRNSNISARKKLIDGNSRRCNVP